MLLAALVDTNRWYIMNSDKTLSVGTKFSNGIVVEDIYVANHFVTELPPGWTALVTLGGPDVDKLTRNTVLARD